MQKKNHFIVQSIITYNNKFYFYFEKEKNEWILNDNEFNFYFDFDNKKLAFISDDYIITEEISGEIRQHKMKHLK